MHLTEQLLIGIALLCFPASCEGQGPAVAPGPRVWGDRPVPSDWKVDELNALFPNAGDDGAVTVLVWQQIDYAGARPGVDRCLAIKSYARPRDGKSFAIGYFLRRRENEVTPWRVWTVIELESKPGEPGSTEAITGYKTLPTEKDVTAFLTKFGWSVLSTPGEIRVSPGRVPKPGEDTRPRIVKFTPTLSAFGLCHRSWLKLFDREAPTNLFPEIQRKPTQPTP
jgi:hypothetical protein